MILEERKCEVTDILVDEELQSSSLQLQSEALDLISGQW